MVSLMAREGSIILTFFVSEWAGSVLYCTVTYYFFLLFINFFVFSYIFHFVLFFRFSCFSFSSPRGSGVRVVSLEDTLEQEHEAFMDDTNR